MPRVALEAPRSGAAGAPGQAPPTPVVATDAKAIGEGDGRPRVLNRGIVEAIHERTPRRAQ